MSVASLHLEKRSAEWEQRVELAACYRLLAHYKMTDLIYTHATVRVPGEPGHFLINPYGHRWEEITASSLVKIDVDGAKIGDSPYRVNPAGFIIHSAVHMARHDAACVIHTHTRAGMAVSAVKDGLLPISQIALQFYGRLGIHDYEGIALDLDERQRIIRDLGGFCGVILRNHGLLTVGRTVAEAFSLMFYLNLACEVQVAALSMALNSSFRRRRFAGRSANNTTRWPSTTAISSSNGRRICACSRPSTHPFERDFISRRVPLYDRIPDHDPNDQDRVRLDAAFPGLSRSGSVRAGAARDFRCELDAVFLVRAFARAGRLCNGNRRGLSCFRDARRRGTGSRLS